MSDLDPIKIKESLTEKLSQVSDPKELGEIKRLFLGEGSDISANQAKMAKLPNEEKAAFGKKINEAKTIVNELIDEAAKRIAFEAEQAELANDQVDMTEPIHRVKPGAVHPLTIINDQVEQIFVSMGWEVAQGPLVEAEYYNFDALNIKPNHPSRSPQDTFYIAPEGSGMVLRTHTSPVQVRSMMERTPPIYVICPGKTFRTDELDATHTPMFSQVEGLAIDKGLTIGDLKGTLEHFATQMFGKDTKIRLRPHFFPFTEPSMELDIWFPNRKDGAGWVEWGGCGMVHPNILRSVGLDPNEYSGFAFGMGLERTLQFSYQISDMRDMIEGDIRFTKAFTKG